MKYLKKFESSSLGDWITDRTKQIKSIEENLSDLFIDFEDQDWRVDSKWTKIVPDRNDWTGNFQSTKVRNVWGGEFIDWTKKVIMSDGSKTWEPVRCFIVNISKAHYIEDINDDKLKQHWSELDESIIKKLPSITSRAERLGLELYGIHGKWFSIGKATHSDFENEPYYGYDIFIDSLSFAFYEKTK